MSQIEPLWLRYWKRLPHSVRKTAHLALGVFFDVIRPAQVALRWRPGFKADEPVIVVGLFSVANGIGASARLFANALEACGLSVVRHDAAAALRHPTDFPASPNQAVSGGMVVTHLNPPELQRWLSRGGARLLKNRRHIGYWSWELRAPPRDWADATPYVDKVLCQSEFTAGAIRSLSSTLDVEVLPHAVAVSFGGQSPQSAPTSNGPVVFLVKADLNSSAARKNPLGAVHAWLRAFAESRPERQRLVCKLRHIDQNPAAFEAIRSAVKGRSDIEILTDTLSQADMAALMDKVDGVISLHRAEGFGLGPAEALWRGKAVIATGWSGSDDFLDDAWAERVSWTPTAVHDPQGRYTGGQWAEPDLDDAAARLRRLVSDPEYRRNLSDKGRQAASRIFNLANWGTRARALLGLPAVAPDDAHR